MTQSCATRFFRWLVVAMTGGFAIVAAPASGQVINEFMRLLANDRAEFDILGSSVDMDNGIVAAGASGDDDNGSGSGSAYLFNASTGVQTAKLLPNDGAAGDGFGSSIAIDNGVVAVSSIGDDDNGSGSGSAYLFDVSTGAQIAKLLPTDGAAGDGFGRSIAINNGVVAVSAYHDDDLGSNSGSAYLFNASTGAQIAKLLPNDGAVGDSFGSSIAIKNGIVAVGAYWDLDAGATSGSAYLFDASTGSQIAKLLPSDGAAGDNFGKSIAIDNGVVAVGAYRDNNWSGSAYLFDASTGSQIAKLLPLVGGGGHVGWSIAIDNGLVAVGAYGLFGSAYLFDASTGSQIARLYPKQPTNGEYMFGGSVAIDNGVIAAGAHNNGDSPGDNLPGSVYLFEVNSTPVAISSFAVRDHVDGVELAWGIAADEPFAGFNIYRSENGGGDVRVNNSILASDARSYVDHTAIPGVRYCYTLVAVGAIAGDVSSRRVEITLPPLTASLDQNIPNPFNPSTTINFVVPKQGRVTIIVYGLDGQKVRTLVNQVRSHGKHSITWDGTNTGGEPVASGVYYYLMRIGNFTETKKMTVLK